jgi:pyruvate dehydrogenase E2 component (dihydrolipoamide acetyltransferase)
MAQFYEMPAVSPTMEVGTIVAWRVKEGQKFESQAVIAEVGTDKANMEAEIFDAGVMLKHLVSEGDEVPAGYPIAIVGKSADEDISALVKEFEARKAAGKPATAPKAEAPKAEEARPPAVEAGESPSAQKSPPPQPEAVRAEAAVVQKAPPGQTLSRELGTPTREWMGKKLSTDTMDPPGDIRYGTQPGRVVASPLAKAVAADLGVDISRVKGSGPSGRIVREDVEKAAKAPQAAPGRPAAAARADEVVRNSPMRKTIAKRLLQSHQDIPTFFLTVSFDTNGMVAFREELKKRDVKVSYNDILVKCVARALRESPKVNASWSDKEIVRHGRVDIGIAVAVQDGLITPVLRNADQMTLTEVSTTTKELAGRAREQKLQPEEYTGSTFTISNLGMYDIQHFTAIINPPESAILAVGTMAQVPVVQDGQLAVGWRMNCTMTCDHRVIDGATGAEFLQVLRRYVESPVLLLT